VGRKKSWTEKLEDSKNLPRVEKITEKMSRKWGSGTVVIPAPKEVYGLMEKVPFGQITTINEIHSALARKHGGTIACPICTGIFARIAAGAAEEQKGRGREITPYWRTLKVGGVINDKYPAGVEEQTRILQNEGHRVAQKGKKYVVADFEKSLATL
jgi:alkylated DNA nucleotide flippase Atl1